MANWQSVSKYVYVHKISGYTCAFPASSTARLEFATHYSLLGRLNSDNISILTRHRILMLLLYTLRQPKLSKDCSKKLLVSLSPADSSSQILHGREP